MLNEPLSFAQQSLAAYIRLMWPGFILGKHHTEIIKCLHAVARGEMQRLMIFCPPRHGKSELCSRFFPAWYLGHNPNRYIITSSYSQDLATDFGEKVRDLVRDPLHTEIFPECQMTESSTAKNRFTLSKGGAYFAVGVGGAITGRGAHLLLIDDPIKDREQAFSETERKRIHDWFKYVAYTRLMPNGAVILINTRWHADDLSGHELQAEMDRERKEGWHVLSLPAVSKEGDLFREPGEALWPEFYSKDALDRIREAVGPIAWAALYDQNPVSEEGTPFKREWLQTYKDIEPRTMNKYILIDPAHSKKKTSDYTAMVVVGLGSDRNYYVLDLIRDRLGLTERGDKLFELHRRWKPMSTGYERYGLQSDIEYLKDRMERENYRFAITELGGSLRKEERIKRLIPLCQQKRMWLPRELHRTDNEGKERDLVDDFIRQEYSEFPASKHDDLLDALARITDEGMWLTWPMTEEENQDALPVDPTGSWMSA